MVLVAKEAEAHHPELLSLPDEVEICHKAAGYTFVSSKLTLSSLTDTEHVFFVTRINLDSIQSEASALVSQLALTTKKVASSVDDVKEQFTKVIEVR